MGRRVASLLVIAVIAVAGLALAGVLDGGAPPPSSTPTPTPTRSAKTAPEPGFANLFVDPTLPGNTCTRSSTRVAYASNAACDTFAAAYAAADQGDLVLVKAGSYPAQAVADDPAKHTGRCSVEDAAECVTVRAAPGEKVTLADLVTRCWNCYFDDFDFTRTGASGDGGPGAKGGRYVVFARMRATEFYIAQESATPKPQNITVYGGEYGPLTTCPGGGMKIGSEVEESPTDIAEMPADITVEGTYIHDFKITPGCAEDHMDCLHVRALAGYFRFLRNRVVGCQNYALLIDGNTGSIKDDILVENNMVGPSVAGPASLALHGGAAGDVFSGSVIFRNNSADEPVTPQTHSTFGQGTFKWVNNYTPSVGACRTGDGLKYAHNVMTRGPACGPGDVTDATFSWADRDTGDLHLTKGSSAIDAGSDAECAHVDFDGDKRVGTCDAGADQP